MEWRYNIYMIKLKMDNKYKLCTCIIVIICQLISNTGTAPASSSNSYELGNGNISYQLDQLISAYKSTDAEYKHDMLSYEINYYDSDLALENYNSVNYQYSQAVEKQAKLQAIKSVYQNYLTTETDPDVIDQINSEIENIDNQIEQYDSSIASISSSKSEYKIQKDIEQFYKDNITLLKQEAENKLFNEFLKKCYNLIILNEKQDYYEAYQKYLDAEYAVATIKYKKGLIDFSSLQLSETNQTKNSIDMQQNNDLYKSNLASIEKKTGIQDSDKIVLPISITEKVYDVENITSTFENNNSSLIQLLYLKKCYQDYQYTNYGTYTLFKQIGLKVQDYQLQYDSLRNEVEKYVKDTIASYQKSWRDYELSSRQVKIAENNYNVFVLKKEHKIATQLDVEKAEYELEASQVSYYQSLCNVIIWQYILDNHVYGETT